jgi:hypothetical protein
VTKIIPRRACALLLFAPVALSGAFPGLAGAGGSFDLLRKDFEATEGKPVVERLALLQALGECEDPRAGAYLADVLVKLGPDPKQTGLIEVVVRCLAVRGDAAALEAVITHGFQYLPELRWKVVGEGCIGNLDDTGITWLTEKGYAAIPALAPRAQRIIVEILASTNDPRAGLAAKKLVGNRKCGVEVQAMFVDLMRVHRVEDAAKKIAPLARFDDAKLQVAVLRALRDLSADDHSKIFLDGLESKHWETRAIAVDIIGGTHDPAVLPELLPLLADPFPEVQVAVVQALRKIGGRAVVPPLIAALKTAAGRVRDDIADTLLWLVGHDLGPDAIAWESWWGIHGASAEVKGITREEFDRLRKESEGASTGTYYGLRVISDYVTFVVDISNSMEEPYRVEVEEPGKEEEEKGTSVAKKKKKEKKETVERRKIDVARDELHRALTGLKNGTQFNLILFDTQVKRWNPELTVMSDEIREEAIAFVKDIDPGGMTNVFDAVMTAIADPKVNTIYFLSDGAPTSGKVTAPEQILELVRAENEIRKVKIHTIGFHLAPDAEDLMRRLAEENLGSFVKR